MKKSFVLFSLAAALLFLIISGCDKTPSNKPNIVFKIDNKQIKKDTITAQLEGYQEVRVETTGNDPKFFRQKNSEPLVDLDTIDDLQVLMYTQSTDYSNKVVEIYTSFPDSVYQKNDVVRIKVQVKELSKSLYYLIE